jgi:hypothetical protein
MLKYSFSSKLNLDIKSILYSKLKEFSESILKNIKVNCFESFSQIISSNNVVFVTISKFLFSGNCSISFSIFFFASNGSPQKNLNLSI